MSKKVSPGFFSVRFFYYFYSIKFKQAMARQISHDELRQRLRSGSFRFYFRKVTGELRLALGTLDLDRVPVNQHPNGTGRSGNQTTFFDLEKGQWRSVSARQEVWAD